MEKELIRESCPGSPQSTQQQYHEAHILPQEPQPHPTQRQQLQNKTSRSEFINKTKHLLFLLPALPPQPLLPSLGLPLLISCRFSFLPPSWASAAPPASWVGSTRLLACPSPAPLATGWVASLELPCLRIPHPSCCRFLRLCSAVPRRRPRNHYQPLKNPTRPRLNTARRHLKAYCVSLPTRCG